MASHAKVSALVHEEKDIVHGDLTGVGLVLIISMTWLKFSKSLTDECFG
jgi:hypothetical protein